jgi:hypothetical protein
MASVYGFMLLQVVDDGDGDDSDEDEQEDFDNAGLSCYERLTVGSVSFVLLARRVSRTDATVQKFGSSDARAKTKCFGLADGIKMRRHHASMFRSREPKHLTVCRLRCHLSVEPSWGWGGSID